MISAIYDTFLIGYRYGNHYPISTVDVWINSTSQFWVDDDYMPTDHMKSTFEHWRNSRFLSGATTLVRSRMNDLNDGITFVSRSMREITNDQ